MCILKKECCMWSWKGSEKRIFSSGLHYFIYSCYGEWIEHLHWIHSLLSDGGKQRRSHVEGKPQQRKGARKWTESGCQMDWATFLTERTAPFHVYCQNYCYWPKYKNIYSMTVLGHISQPEQDPSCKRLIYMIYSGSTCQSHISYSFTIMSK